MAWVTICAIVLGPFLGIWVHGKLEDRKATYRRKLEIFKTLMATRATPLAPAHVEALNQIDIEFTGRNEKDIRDDWAELLDHYSNGPNPPRLPPNPNPETQNNYDREFLNYNSKFGIWDDKTKVKRSKLLHKMANIFKYDFDKVRIDKAIYYPRLHGDIENERLLILKSANKVLLGLSPLYVANWHDQTTPHPQESKPMEDLPQRRT